MQFTKWVTLVLLLAAPVPGTAEEAVSSTAPAVATIELARVNGEIVTDADLSRAFVGKHGGHSVFLGGEIETRRFLDIVINERLLIQEAYNLELDREPEISAQVEEFRNRTAANLLLKREIEDKSVPSKDDIQKAWELARELFIAREIVTSTREEAESIRRAVMSGVQFETLARSCSVAPSRTRGGSLPPFTWGSLTPEIEATVFPMEPGEVSQPFDTGAGWGLLLLIDRMEASRPEMSDQVSARIAARLTERSKKALTDALSKRLWKDWDAHIDVDEFSASKLQRLSAANPGAAVAEWKGGQLTVAQAFTPGELRMFATLDPVQSQTRIRDTLTEAVNTALVQREARAQKLDEEPAAATSIDRFETQLMEKALYAGHVLNAVTVSDEEIRASYEQQKAKLIVPERRRVAHIAVATEKEARELQSRLQRGADFLEVLKTHTLDKTSIKTGGDLGMIEKGAVDAKFDSLFALPLNGISDPIQTSDSWHVVKINAIEAEHPLPFEAARERIRTSLLEKKKHDAREVWINKLREHSEIVLIPEGIAAFVKANPYQEPAK